MQAVILAAGMGTRMGELTKETPKPMLPLLDKTIVEHILKRLPKTIKEVVIVVSANTKQAFENYLGAQFTSGSSSISIRYAVQDESFNGTYGALYAAKPFLKSSFLVLNGDDIIDTQSLELMSEYDLSMGFTSQVPPAPNYFIFRTTQDGYVKEMTRPTEEELTSEQLIATGTYVLNSNIWDLEPVNLKGSEYGLPQTLQPILSQFRAVTLKQWLKINTPEDQALAESALSKVSS